MADFNIAVRMEWLTTFKTYIDCYNRKVTFQTLEGEGLKFLRSKCWSPIFPLMELVLANIWVEDMDEKVTELPFAIQEYIDVFPKELPGLLNKS